MLTHHLRQLFPYARDLDSLDTLDERLILLANLNLRCLDRPWTAWTEIPSRNLISARRRASLALPRGERGPSYWLAHHIIKSSAALI